jgi:hypothetical protein
MVFGHKLFVDTRDVSITPHLLLDGLWEPWVTTVIRRIVRPGLRVFDIGADCGYYAVLMADLVCETGQRTAAPELLQQRLRRHPQGAAGDLGHGLVRSCLALP